MTATLDPAIERIPQLPAEKASLFSPWRILAVAAGAYLVAHSVHRFIDVDLYWHIKLGDEILRTHHVNGVAATWSYTTLHAHWTTTQWLSEVILALVHRAAGWNGIAVLRTLVAAVVAVTMARQLLPGRRTPWAPVVYGLSLAAASVYFQERPQLASIMLLVWLAGVARRELRGERLPSWWSVVLITWLWANLHGLWSMVPYCYGLLAAGQLITWLRSRRTTAFPRRTLLLTAATAAVAGLTPVGPSLIVSPFSFAGATKHIQEWAPTNFRSLGPLTLFIVVALVVIAWARCREAVGVEEIVYVGGLVVFSLFALRDVPPAVMLLAPIAVDRLSAAFPLRDEFDRPAERRVVVALSATMLVVGVMLTVVRLFTIPPLPMANKVPIALAQRLAQEPGHHLVLDDYNASGTIIYWGGPNTQVAVDGRADRYGGPFLDKYLELMTTVGDQWPKTLAGLHPNYALLESQAPIVRELKRSGWSAIATDNKWILLRAPGGSA